MAENEEKRQTELVIEFLSDSLRHLERRILIVDNKSSILFAVLAALLAAAVIFLTDGGVATNLDSINLAFRAIAFGFLFLGAFAALFLVQTIRPTDWFLGLKSTTADLDEVANYVMWPKAGFPRNEEEYLEKIGNLSAAEIRGNYQRAHFTALQLVREKYRFYRLAALFIKLLVVWGIISAALLVASTLA